MQAGICPPQEIGNTAELWPGLQSRSIFLQRCRRVSDFGTGELRGGGGEGGIVGGAGRTNRRRGGTGRAAGGTGRAIDESARRTADGHAASCGIRQGGQKCYLPEIVPVVHNLQSLQVTGNPLFAVNVILHPGRGFLHGPFTGAVAGGGGREGAGPDGPGG